MLSFWKWCFLTVGVYGLLPGEDPSGWTWFQAGMVPLPGFGLPQLSEENMPPPMNTMSNSHQIVAPLTFYFTGLSLQNFDVWRTVAREFLDMIRYSRSDGHGGMQEITEFAVVNVAKDLNLVDWVGAKAMGITTTGYYRPNASTLEVRGDTSWDCLQAWYSRFRDFYAWTQEWMESSSNQAPYLMSGTASLYLRAGIYRIESPSSHRGLWIDTSKHYIPKQIIKRIIQNMALANLNVLHWQVTDSQSFPLVLANSAVHVHGTGAPNPVITRLQERLPSVSALDSSLTNVAAKFAKGHAIILNVTTPDNKTHVFAKEDVDIEEYVKANPDMDFGLPEDLTLRGPHRARRLGQTKLAKSSANATIPVDWGTTAAPPPVVARRYNRDPAWDENLPPVYTYEIERMETPPAKPYRGAFSNAEIYTWNDLMEIKHFAYNRGILIVFEAQMTTGAKSIAAIHPNNAVCTSKDHQSPFYCKVPPCGMMNPKPDDDLQATRAAIIQDLIDVARPTALVNIGDAQLGSRDTLGYTNACLRISQLRNISCQLKQTYTQLEGPAQTWNYTDRNYNRAPPPVWSNTFTPSQDRNPQLSATEKSSALTDTAPDFAPVYECPAERTFAHIIHNKESIPDAIVAASQDTNNDTESRYVFAHPEMFQIGAHGHPFLIDRPSELPYKLALDLLFPSLDLSRGSEKYGPADRGFVLRVDGNTAGPFNIESILVHRIFAFAQGVSRKLSPTTPSSLYYDNRVTINRAFSRINMSPHRSRFLWETPITFANNRVCDDVMSWSTLENTGTYCTLFFNTQLDRERRGPVSYIPPSPNSYFNTSLRS